jgi:hypothetical protein
VGYPRRGPGHLARVLREATARNASPLLASVRLSGGLAFGVWGLAAGALFALSLSKTVHSDTVDNITPRRAAVWGGLAGAGSVIAMPLIGLTAWPVLLVGAAIGASIGSTAAALTVGVARRPLPRTAGMDSSLLSGRL